MKDLEFSFEQSPWELLFQTKRPGDSVSAVNLLAMLESEDEQSVEDALLALQEGGLVLDLTDLPKSGGNGEAARRLRQEESMAARGLRIQDMEENDPLRLYLEEVAGTPAFGDETLLAEECASGKESAMEALTNLGLHRVVTLAAENVGYGVLLLDLIQEGSLGLWQGIQSYRSGDYAAHRDYYIRNAMARAIVLQARSNGVGQKMRQALEDYRAVDERLLSDLGRNPTVEEIAFELHISPDEAESVGKMLEDARLMQRATQGQKEEDPPSEEEDQAVEDTAYFAARQRILELLSILSQEDAKLLTLRFGLEKGVPLSPEETGKRLGMTKDEVIAREAKALAMLRNEK